MIPPFTAWVPLGILTTLAGFALAAGLRGRRWQ